MTRALLYTRQSDSDGEGSRSLSLDSQASVLRADADRFGWQVVAEIRDADAKGWDPHRPGLLETYTRCREGSVDLVAFWSLSRLARRVRIIEEIFDELTALGVELYSHEESWIAQPMLRQIMSAVNEYRTQEIKAHVRRALRERARRKLAHGPAPFGYQRTEAGVLAPTDDAAVVERIYRERAAGANLRQIAEALHAAGIPAPSGKPWTYQTLAKIVSNPVYRGTIRFAEVEVNDAHEPIVDDTLWRHAQAYEVPARWRSPRGGKRSSSWLEGLIVHECGVPMYLFGATGRSRPADIFRCRTGAGWLGTLEPCAVLPRQIAASRAEVLAWEAVGTALERLLSPERVFAAARREYRALTPATEAARNEAQERKKRAVERRKRAEDLYLSGSRDRAWFDAQDAHTCIEIAEADATLSRLPTEPDPGAVEATWLALRGLRDGLALIEGDDRAPVLRRLGIVVIGPSGVKVGRADTGRVAIRFRPEWRGFFADEKP